MRVYRDHHRTLAASCYSSHGGDIRLATIEFTCKLKEMALKVPRDAACFVKYWGNYYAVNRSVAGKASSSGRRSKLTDEQLMLILDVIVNWRRDGRSGPYRSMKEVKKCSALVRDMITAAGCTTDTVRRSLKRLCPELVYKKLWVKPKLTDKHKSDRYDTCCQLLERSEKDLEKVVWLDAKSIYMTIAHRKGWVLLGEQDIFETIHPPSKKQPMVLKYYAAVNYRVGPVALIFYTGTTGMKADRDPSKTYKVS